MLKKLMSKLSGSSTSDVIEFKACTLDEIPKNGLKKVENEHGKVLLVREEDDIYAIGTRCSHYGAPLVQGVLYNGQIRCPWHGACFSVKTGDIEDFPGFGSLPSYQVTVKNGDIWVKGNREELSKDSKKKTLCSAIDGHECYVIVGGGAAGFQCIETLRQEGFKGRITVLTAENVLPYDRTKLSKAPNTKVESLIIRDTEYYSSNNIDVMVGKKVISIDNKLKVVHCADESSFKYDKLFLGTGILPRPFDAPGCNLRNILYLRDHLEANTIAEKGVDKNVVLIGSSFIAMETAAYLSGKAKSVTIIARNEYPFQMFGEELGKEIRKLYESKDVKYLANKQVVEFRGQEQLESVVLNDDSVLPADICVIGIGSVANVEYLKGSNVDLDSRENVIVNENFETSLPGVYAGGDMVAFKLDSHDLPQVSIGHWQVAQFHGKKAALSMLGKTTDQITVPFFWSMIFGKGIRFAGYADGNEEIFVIKGDGEWKYAIYYFKSNKVTAVCTIGMDPLASLVASLLSKKRPIPVDLVKENPLSWREKYEPLQVNA